MRLMLSATGWVRWRPSRWGRAGPSRSATSRSRCSGCGTDLRATQALCPHAGGPLADAQADPAKIVCPLHNYAYSVHDGTCLNGPYTIRTYPAREEAGDIIVDL